MKSLFVNFLSICLLICSFCLGQNIQEMIERQEQESAVVLPRRKPTPPPIPAYIVYEQLLAGMNATKTVKGYPLPVPDYK